MDREMEKLCVAYLRVSSKEQVENFSLDNQLEQIKRKAEIEGYTLAKIFREEGESAKTTDRTQLKELIRFVTDKTTMIRGVFVYKYDRLNRNQLDFLMLRKMFAKHGISLFSATEISGETPEASFVQSLLASFAEFENTVRTQRIEQGMKARFMAGYSTVVYPHPGYKKALIEGKSVEVPDGDKFILLQRMWKNIAYEQWTLGRVRKYLNQSGLFKQFSKQDIGKLFANTFYMGILQSKKYGQAKGKHEAMIDSEVFYRARAAIKGRLPIPKKIKNREELPLRKFLQCIHCPDTLTGSASKSRHGYKVYYYNCNNRQHKYFGINAKRTNEAFIELLQKIKVKPKAMTYFEELLRETYEEEYVDLTSSSKQIKKDIEIIDAALLKLKRKHLEGIYDDQEFKEMKEELNIERLTKQQLLGEKKVDKLDIETILTWMRYYLTHLDEAWLKATPEGKLAIEGSVFPEKLTYSGEGFTEPKLGMAYRLNEFYSNSEYRQSDLTRTLLASFQDVYSTLHPFVTI